MIQKYADFELREQLKDLPGWESANDNIEKRFPFRSYMDGIRFVEALALEAEARDHHPDMLLVRYSEVTVYLSTHENGGVTFKDVELARAAEKIAGALLDPAQPS